MNRTEMTSHPQPRWLMAVVLVFSAMSLDPFDGVGGQQTRQGQVNGQIQRGEEGQAIRLGTQLVNVLFSVTDKDNHYISNLSKSDVTVLENGKPQVIFTFKHELDLPLTIAILVDTSNSVLPVLPRLTDAGSQFINSVIRMKDTAAIVQFDSEATLIRDLTSSVARLRSGLREIAGIESERNVVFGGTLPPINTGSRLGGTSIYDSIAAVCEDLLVGKAGRKTIILFTDGYDTTSRLKRSEAVDEAIRAEAVIYAIGIGDQKEEGVNKGELNKLCDPTGGRAFIPRDVEDLDRAFTQLEEELRRQYLLAYEPSNDAVDGSFRKIEVRVANRKGIRIRHRRGYYAVRQ
ncbi:MAG: VWA domain-containing protein [Acidobacteria bacterium]|nr:VWA domain-containing protein [Acidobacteriota bacterium]